MYSVRSIEHTAPRPAQRSNVLSEEHRTHSPTPLLCMAMYSVKDAPSPRPAQRSNVLSEEQRTQPHATALQGNVLSEGRTVPTPRLAEQCTQ